MRTRIRETFGDLDSVRGNPLALSDDVGLSIDLREDRDAKE